MTANTLIINLSNFIYSLYIEYSTTEQSNLCCFIVTFNDQINPFTCRFDIHSEKTLYLIPKLVQLISRWHQDQECEM